MLFHTHIIPKQTMEKFNIVNISIVLARTIIKMFHKFWHMNFFSFF